MADNSTMLFEPDALMPEQFFANGGRDCGAANEKTLMLAILRDAVECHQKYALSRNPQTRDLFDEADEWIFSCEREWPFSFENICDVLGISSDYIRAGLERNADRSAAKERRTPRIVSIGDRRDECDAALAIDAHDPVALSEAS